MRAFVWLLVSGAFWLVLVRSASYFDVQPQSISLARSLYIGTFSIFMIVEMRRTVETRFPLALNPFDLVWYLAPTISVFALWLFSESLHVTPWLLALLCTFYILQLIIQLVRAREGGMRSGIWELAPPVIIAVLLFSHSILWLVLMLSVGMLLFMLSRRVPAKAEVADSLIMQLPSLSVAPIVLILLRDEVERATMLSRGPMEMIGMVVNGAGGALWTAMVMRNYSLRGAAVTLWVVSTVASSVLAFVPGTQGSIGYLVAVLLAAEMLRGSLWLGLTAILSGCRRWVGFIFNLGATALPVVSLLIARELVKPDQVIALYAALHFVIPLAIWGAQKVKLRQVNSLSDV